MCLTFLRGKLDRLFHLFLGCLEVSAFWKELHQRMYLNRKSACTLAEALMNIRRGEGRAWFALFQGLCASYALGLWAKVAQLMHTMVSFLFCLIAV